MAGAVSSLVMPMSSNGRRYSAGSRANWPVSVARGTNSSSRRPSPMSRLRISSPLTRLFARLVEAIERRAAERELDQGAAVEQVLERRVGLVGELAHRRDILDVERVGL